jgi:cytochrome P450
LLGTLEDFVRDPLRQPLRLRETYGDVIRQRLGPFLAHTLLHPDDIKHVLQDNAANYCRGKFYDKFKPFFGHGLLTMDGKEWLLHRRLAQPYFHRRAVAAMAGTMTECIDAMLQRWAASAALGGPVDVIPEMMRLTLSVLGRIVFRVDLGDEAGAVGPAVRFGLEAIMPQGTLNDLLPLWLPTPHGRRVRRAQRTLRRIMDRVIEEHRRGEHGDDDLVSMLLAARDEETGQGLSHTQVRDELMTIFLAGHETTGTGLAWTLYELARHPAAWRRAAAEVAQVVGGGRPEVADLPRLPYTRMVVDEALRLHPPIWTFPRDAIGDDEIAGYHVPARSTIFLSPYSTHRHPAFWEDPETFDPQRFTPERAAGRPRYAYFPFGGGQRQCIGNHMALMQMQLAVAMIVQRYRLDVVPGHSVECGALLSLRPLGGIPLTITALGPGETRPAVPASTTPGG